MSVVLLLVTTTMLGLSAVLFAASLRLREMTAFLLAAYLIAFGELVVVVVGLSPLHLVRRDVLAPTLLVPLIAAAFVWNGTGRPSPPSLRRAGQTLARALHDPPLALLAGVVAVAFAYLIALGLGTPANAWDAMWYHLARAAFWKQQHAVGYVAHANDARLNANPPVAEIGALYGMV